MPLVFKILTAAVDMGAATGETATPKRDEKQKKPWR
jgi:hypothetical protein